MNNLDRCEVVKYEQEEVKVNSRSCLEEHENNGVGGV